MGFAYLTNIPLEKAREDYIDFLEKRGFSAKTETVKTVHAAGRITAEPVYAKINAPHYAASAMDGVAIIAADSFGATETTPKVIAKENYAIVDTGDPVPNEFDAVVMVEEIINNDDGSITLHEAANPWQHIRQIGEDICAGEMILTSKTKVSPAAVGAMIAGGVTELSVIKKPVVGIIPTGDEIVPSDTVPKAGEILEFNSSIISAILSENSAEPKVYDIVKDNLEDIKNALQKACNDCDIVILNAGTSAGREDFGREAISELGECLYHGIAIKPGKPAILGAVGKVPVLGIPGYPVSAIIVIEELLNPLISHISSTAAKKKYTEAILTRQILSGLKYKEFVRVKMGYVGNILTATPLARGAGVVSSFMKADGILEIPQNTEGYKAGEKVRIRLLSDEEQLKNTLVIIGSHDPLIDELSELIHAEDSSKYLSSSHVGSMGGIMAIKRKEAHAAGCHLLDAETGKYNIPYIKKHFPQGGVRLISCVGRIQGLMTAKNNPHNIKSLSDITKDGLRYVNRQKGSGTRVLLDYLCREQNIDTENIKGYDREELTHTSVAVQIASGSADVGLGIYSAAALYNLDFIPIKTEQYSLLVLESEQSSPMVKKLIETLKSEKFRKKIEQMGGYTLDSPGEILY